MPTRCYHRWNCFSPSVRFKSVHPCLYKEVAVAKSFVCWCTEEGTVRDAAVESTKTVTNVLSPEKFQSVYFDMLSDLMGEEWFTARMSASTILASAYSRFSREQQESLIQGFSALCRDDTPMVRRVASQQLGPVLQAVAKVLGRSCFEEGGTVVNTILPLYEELASNEQPVRSMPCLCIFCCDNSSPKAPRRLGFGAAPNNGKLCGLWGGTPVINHHLFRPRNDTGPTAFALDCSND